MIILDTNIISEMMKSSPDNNLVTWMDEQKPSELFITSISIAEISYGISVLPKGKRQNTLKTAFNNTINEGFGHHILAFNEKAAYEYGNLMAHRKSLGRPLSICDGQIAAIAHLHEYALATRNIKDFSACDIKLINPFH